MGRKSHESLKGLVPLGARLKEIREGAGLSQMKLSELMGFDPKHGYKYILRLEKGQVPNPTMRTIISYLESCGSGWPDIAGTMPFADGPRPVTARPKPEEEPVTAGTAVPERPKPAAPRDPRPLRVRLRSEMLAGRSRRTQEFWTRVARADDDASALLRSNRVVSSAWHAYRAFVRPCCSVIAAGPASRPKVIEREVARLVDSAVEAGLDRDILEAVRSACLKRMTEPAGHKA